MFKTLLTDKLMLAWVGLPAFIAFAIFFMQCRSAKPEEKKYKAETFRNPINTAVTVSGLIIPLVCASISYLANQSVSPRELIPLIACLILLTMAILVGLYSYVGNNPLKYTDPTGHAWLLFDGQAWGALPGWFVQDVLIGNTGTTRFNPNSVAVLKETMGVGVTPLRDESGNIVQPGDAVMQVGGAVVQGPLEAGMWLGGGGEAKGAYQFADKMLKARKVEKSVIAAERIELSVAKTKQAVQVTKAMNLPALKQITIDIEHIASGHMKGGARVSPKRQSFQNLGH